MHMPARGIATAFFEVGQQPLGWHSTRFSVGAPITSAHQVLPA